MQTKLQELTEKIYLEGVLKAQNEAATILADAREEAARILSEAQKEAAGTLARAQQKADEAKKNFDAELKAATSQTVASVKQQIAALVTAKVIDAPTNQAFNNAAFVQSLIKALVDGYVQSGQMEMTLILPLRQRDEMERFFQNSLAAELSKGITIEYSQHVGAGFKVAPRDNSYVVGFTDTDFANYFKAFLRPQTARLLFEPL